MAERLFLGVDGGGTATRVRLTDAAGRVLGEGQAGSSNLNMGTGAARASIISATDAAIGAAGLSAADRGRIVAGLGLAGANVRALADGLMAEPFPFAALTLASDAVIACLGAHGGGDGAILILGTGSQGLAMVAGTVRTVGGWGFELSDEGSGAVLGRAAIHAAILAFDGLAPASALTDAVLARFDGDPSIAAVWGKTAGPRDYGTFAPLVLEHFAADDPVATMLMTQSLNSVHGMLDRLVGFGAQRIALMGGLAPAYAPLVRPDLQAHLVAPQSDALDGALALARNSLTA